MIFSGSVIVHVITNQQSTADILFNKTKIVKQKHNKQSHESKLHENNYYVCNEFWVELH